MPIRDKNRNRASKFPPWMVSSIVNICTWRESHQSTYTVKLIKWTSNHSKWQINFEERRETNAPKNTYVTPVVFNSTAAKCSPEEITKCVALRSSLPKGHIRKPVSCSQEQLPLIMVNFLFRKWLSLLQKQGEKDKLELKMHPDQKQVCYSGSVL